MISTKCPSCKAPFDLKDEFVGKKARCPNCSNVFEVATQSAELEPIEFITSGIFSKNTYGIKQKRISLKEKYYVRTTENVDILFAVRDLKFFQSLFAIFAAIAT